KQKQEAQLKAQQQQQQQVQTGQGVPAVQPGQSAAPPVPGQPASRPGQQLTREAAIKASPRVRIDTPRLSGSISLKGAQIDDLALTQFHETVDKSSPPIVLLERGGSPHPFYAEFGWVGDAGSTVKVPD